MSTIMGNGTDASDDILGIDASDPLVAIIEVEKRVRPELDRINTDADIEIVHAYHAAVKHACKLFEVGFEVSDPEDQSVPTARRLLYQTKAAIDRKKIDLLHERSKAASTVALDAAWRDKIHSYVATIRKILEHANIPLDLRDSILGRLHALDQEVDRTRTRIRVFTDVLVGLCEGISAGADALKPAVRLFERIVGAISRLQSGNQLPVGPKPLELPPPDALGLIGNPTEDEELQR